MAREMKTQMSAPQWRRIALGSGAGVLTLLTVSGACAGLMAREVIGLDGLRWCAAGALLLAGIIAGRTAGGLLDAALAALGVSVVLIVLNIGLFDGKMEGAAFSALALSGGCGASMLLGGRSGGRRSTRRRKKTVKLPKSRIR